MNFLEQLLSQKVLKVHPSVTLALNARVQALQAKGEKILNLTAGEPDFFPLEEAQEGVRAALEAHKGHYPPVAGLPELRSLIAKRQSLLQPSVRSKWEGKHVLVTNGGKQALFQALFSVLNHGDIVAFPAPYWVSYPEMVRLCEGEPFPIPTLEEEGFKLQVDDLEKHYRPQWKVLILNSPHNPTSAVYQKEELQAIGNWIQEKAPQLLVLSDEIYQAICWETEKVCSFLEACPDLKDQVMTVDGLSKSAAITGWRIGWGIGPETWIQSASKIQSHSTSGVSVLSQWGALAVLRKKEDLFQSFREAYRKRRDLVLSCFSKKKNLLKWILPEGAFYCFFSVQSKRIESIHFSEKLLEKKKVAVIPGSAFGCPSYIRMSFAAKESVLEEACQRILDFVEHDI